MSREGLRVTPAGFCPLVSFFVGLTFARGDRGTAAGARDLARAEPSATAERPCKDKTNATPMAIFQAFMFVSPVRASDGTLGSYNPLTPASLAQQRRKWR